MRAIAVSAVVLCHAHLFGFTGGFLGVDIFFVISGFLITNILIKSQAIPYDGLTRDKVKPYLLEFYERRVRRIVPALFMVLAASTTTAFVLFSPYELRDFANGLLASTGFVANLFFLAGTDYWAPRYETPLLHLWSLGVEEQFYIFYPLFLAWLGTRKSKRVLLPVLAAISLGTLILSEVLVREALPKGYEYWFAAARHWPKMAAFYFTGTRAWELLLGAMVAMRLDADGGAVRLPVGAAGRQLLAALALTMVTAPIFLVDQDTPWPGLFTLFPCAGAALLIYMHAGERTWVWRLLSCPPMVGVGLISYSLYLWHWPIFEFYRRWVLRQPTSGEYGVLIVLAVVLAWASWRFVERPFRRRDGFSRRTIFRLAAAAAALLVFVAAGALAFRGLPQRFSPSVRAVYAIMDGHGPKPHVAHPGLKNCYVRNHAPSYSFSRCFVVAKDRPNVVLWGDSLAGTYYTGFHERAVETGVNLISANHFDCRPVADARLVPPACARFNASVMARFDRHTVALISARYYANRDLVPSLTDLVRRLAARGVRVVVLGPALEYREAGPFFVARFVETKNSQWIDSRFALKADYVAFDRQMRQAVSGIPGAGYVSVYDAVCRQGRCPMMMGDTSVQSDFAHLTGQGSLLFGNILWPRILSAAGLPVTGPAVSKIFQ